MKHLIILSFFVFVSHSVFAQDSDPIPYPPIETKETDKVDKKKKVDLESSSENSDSKTQKGLVTIGGSTPKFMMGSFNVFMEGSSAPRFTDINTHNRQRPLSQPDVASDCGEHPGDCALIIESMVSKQYENLSKLEAKEDGAALKLAIQSFEKSVPEQVGFWAMVNGEWIRIDTDIELAKAVLKNLKEAKGK